jgi:heme exporter protein CcmD
MNHWVFIWAAYGVTALGTLGMLGWSLRAMFLAERAISDLEESR